MLGNCCDRPEIDRSHARLKKRTLQRRLPSRRLRVRQCLEVDRLFLADEGRGA